LSYRGTSFYNTFPKPSPPSISASPASLFSDTPDKLAGQKNLHVIHKLRIACFPELSIHILFQIIRNFSQANIS